MSNQTDQTPSSNQNDARIKQLLREGIAASKMGDKTTARAKLQEVVALDQYNELGWFWLASVVETDEERRACLGNVVVINPKNERAQRLLNDLTDATLGLTGPVREDLLTDGPRFLRDRRMVLIGAGIIGLVLMLAILILSGSGGPPPEPTIAVLAQATSSAAVAGTEAVTLTPTLPLVQPTLPPTWTPSPEVNSTGPTLLPSPPPDLTGRLVVAQGSLVTSDRNLPIVVMDPYGKNVRKVSQGDVGDYGILTPDGQRLVYARFLASTNSQQLRAMAANGSQGAEVSTLWSNLPPLANMQMPSISRNGAVLVFSAINIPENDGTPDLYMLPAKNLPPAGIEPEATVGDEATEEVTNTPTLISAQTSGAPTATSSAPAIKPVRVTAKDSGANTWPSVSPDGKFVIYVSDSKSLGEDGIDLYIVAIGGKPKKLTTDGLANIEAAPEWSPDAKMIAYQSMAQDSKTSDIYVINADGTNPVKLTEGEGDNARPHWSADGKFIAFSSTRSGRWQVYIMEVATKTIYQVTSGKESSICTNWGPK